MALGDITSATRIREVITSIATEVVNRIRPDERIGTVFSYNRGSNTAKIMFAGETVDSLVEVRFSANNAPMRAMSDTYSTEGDSAIGDIVRVGGKPGAYYIIDFISGTSRAAASVNPTGAIVMWSTATAPVGYLLCNGSTFSKADYPDLALVLGDTYGVHSVDDYYLPDFRARSPIGTGGQAVPDVGSNSYYLGHKHGHEEMPVHNHGINDPGHAHGYYAGYAEGLDAANWTFGNSALGPRNFNVSASNTTNPSGTGVTVANSGTGTSGNVHPVLGIGFIIKT